MDMAVSLFQHPFGDIMTKDVCGQLLLSELESFSFYPTVKEPTVGRVAADKHEVFTKCDGTEQKRVRLRYFDISEV